MDSENTSFLESDMPLSDLNEGSYKERYARKGHPRAIKTWWARRPHIAMRGILYASLVGKEGYENKKQRLQNVSQSVHPPKKEVDEIRSEITREWSTKPKILDFFSGGGVIPYEAARLGLDTHSLDLNEASVILQKAIIEGPKEFPEIHKDVEKWGAKVLQKSKEETEDLFNYTGGRDGESPIAYFFSRTIPCPNCRKTVPLFNIGSLSKKDDPVYVDLNIQDNDYQYKLSNKEPNFENKGRGGKTECPFCKESIQKNYLKKCGKEGNIDEELFAFSTVNESKHGKNFYIIREQNNKYPESTVDDIQKRCEKIIEEIGSDIPEVILKKWSGILNPALYGHQNIEDIFNERQNLVILTLIKNIKESYEDMIRSEMSHEKAKYILYIFTSLTDHLADWSNRFTMWIPQNEQCGRSLAGPGVPMRWDYIEINPFGDGPANLFDKLDRAVTSLRQTPEFNSQIKIEQGDATNLPYQDNKFDLIMVDPPYYNSLIYSGLSDFFIPWQEMIFNGIDHEFEEIYTHSKKEIVAHEEVKGDDASEFYTKSLTDAFSEANRVLKNSGLFITVYSHKSIEAWAALAHSIKESGFQVTNVVPIDMERTARPRAMNSDALSSVMNVVMRYRESSNSIHFSRLQKEIKSDLKDEVSEIFEQKWVSSDLLTFVFSKSLKRYTAHPSIFDDSNDELDFEDYYTKIKNLLAEVIADEYQALLNNTDWDMKTEIYIRYRLEYGYEQIPVEDFETMLTSLGEYELSDLESDIYSVSDGEISLHPIIDDNHEVETEQNSLIGEVAYITDYVNSQDTVSNEIPRTVTHPAKDLRQVFNLLAGTELTSINGESDNVEAQRVRQAISKLAEKGNLLESAVNQRKLTEF